MSARMLGLVEETVREQERTSTSRGSSPSRRPSAMTESVGPQTPERGRSIEASLGQERTRTSPGAAHPWPRRSPPRCLRWRWRVRGSPRDLSRAWRLDAETMEQLNARGIVGVARGEVVQTRRAWGTREGAMLNAGDLIGMRWPLRRMKRHSTLRPGWIEWRPGSPGLRWRSIASRSGWIGLSARCAGRSLSRWCGARRGWPSWST